MNVKALVDIASKNGTIVAGTCFDIPEQVFVKLAGKVEAVPATAANVESITAARMEGDTCVIRYTPELYQQHRHRNGEQITVDGISAKIIIEEITP